MLREDMVVFLALSVAILFCAMVLEGLATEKRHKQLKYISIALMGLAAYFILHTSLFWFEHSTRISSNIDIHLMYRGAAAKGSPYVGATTVDSPIFFSLARFFTSVLGDGSKEAYSRFIDWGQRISLGIMAVCLATALPTYVRRERNPWFGVASALCVCFICIMPMGVDVGLGNTNLLATAGVTAYFTLGYLFRGRVAKVLSGVALGLGFMIKPHLFLVVVYLLCSGLKKKEYYTIGGMITIGIVGFLASLMVPGIDIGAFADFLSKNPEWLVSQPYRNNVGNLSLILYVPIENARLVSTLSVLGFTVLAIVASWKEVTDEIPWFFITIVPLPVLWGAYIMTNALPTVFFQILTREKRDQFAFCVLAIALVFSSTLFNMTILTNSLLIGVWVWQMLAGLSKNKGEPLAVASSGECAT